MRQPKYTKLHTTPPPLRGPKVPWKDLALSVFLLVVGIVFIGASVVTFWVDSLYEAMPFFLLGALCLIPGAYHSFIFLMVFRKVPGWSFDMISTYQK
mmetsp:Transcript_819/g.1744  ORF Transcript_819/g.1744 Transcript_819/m.1744 type:complete len:97 (-) Transcript_819:87-377(-)